MYSPRKFKGWISCGSNFLSHTEGELLYLWIFSWLSPPSNFVQCVLPTLRWSKSCTHLGYRAVNKPDDNLCKLRVHRGQMTLPNREDTITHPTCMTVTMVAMPIFLLLCSLFARFCHWRGEHRSRAQICWHCGACTVRCSLNLLRPQLCAHKSQCITYEWNRRVKAVNLLSRLRRYP